MPPVKRLLKDTSVETAQRRRICHGNRKQSIAKGEKCLVVKDPVSGGKRNYNAECAKKILKAAREDIDNLESELFN